MRKPDEEHRDEAHPPERGRQEHDEEGEQGRHRGEKARHLDRVRGVVHAELVVRSKEEGVDPAHEREVDEPLEGQFLFEFEPLDLEHQPVSVGYKVYYHGFHSEKGGFEPPVPLPVQLLSRQLPSASRAPLLYRVIVTAPPAPWIDCSLIGE